MMPTKRRRKRRRRPSKKKRKNNKRSLSLLTLKKLVSKIFHSTLRISFFHDECLVTTPDISK
jgi:hypothetical protein